MPVRREVRPPHCGRSFDRRGRKVSDCTGVVLRSQEFAHGVVEAQTQDVRAEVDGISGEVALGPAPVAVLHDETGKGGHEEVAAAGFDEGEAAFFEERPQGHEPGRADLLTRPPWRRGCAIKRAAVHHEPASQP